MSAASVLFLAQSPAAAQVINGCTVSLVQPLLSSIVPGKLVVTDNHTTLSSLEPGGESGKVGLVCTQSFSASINDNDIQQLGATGVTQFASIDADVTETTVVGIEVLGLITTSANILDIDLVATDPDTQVIGAGEYFFSIPITISGN